MIFFLSLNCICSLRNKKVCTKVGGWCNNFLNAQIIFENLIFKNFQKKIICSSFQVCPKLMCDGQSSFFQPKKDIFYFIIMSQKFREIFCYLILGFSTLEISNLLFELSPLIFHEFLLVWHGNFHLIKRCMKLKNKIN